MAAMKVDGYVSRNDAEVAYQCTKCRDFIHYNFKGHDLCRNVNGLIPVSIYHSRHFKPRKPRK